MPPTLRCRSARSARRTALGGHPEQRLTREPDAGEDSGLTQAVLGIAQAAQGDTTPLAPEIASVMFGGQEFVETAVYATQEGRPAVGAPGFRNTADSDPALAVNREWSRDILARVESSTAGDATIDSARIDDAQVLEETIARVKDAAARWGALPAADRAVVLERAASALEARRGELIEVAASETGQGVRRGGRRGERGRGLREVLRGDGAASWTP